MPRMATTTYEPGAVKTAVSGLPEALGGTGAAPYAGMDLIQKLIAKRLQEAENERIGRRQGVGMVPLRMAQPPKLGSTRPADQAMETMARRVAMAQAQAQTERAPMKLVTGASVIPGWMMDPNAMTGAQRARFLPGGAGIAPPQAMFGPSQMEQWAAQRGFQPLEGPK